MIRKTHLKINKTMEYFCKIDPFYENMFSVLNLCWKE